MSNSLCTLLYRGIYFPNKKILALTKKNEKQEKTEEKMKRKGETRKSKGEKRGKRGKIANIGL